MSTEIISDTKCFVETDRRNLSQIATYRSSSSSHFLAHRIYQSVEPAETIDTPAEDIVFVDYALTESGSSRRLRVLDAFRSKFPAPTGYSRVMVDSTGGGVMVYEDIYFHGALIGVDCHDEITQLLDPDRFTPMISYGSYGVGSACWEILLLLSYLRHSKGSVLIPRRAGIRDYHLECRHLPYEAGININFGEQKADRHYLKSSTLLEQNDVRISYPKNDQEYAKLSYEQDYASKLEQRRDRRYERERRKLEAERELCSDVGELFVTGRLKNLDSIFSDLAIQRINTDLHYAVSSYLNVSTLYWGYEHDAAIGTKFRHLLILIKLFIMVYGETNLLRYDRFRALVKYWKRYREEGLQRFRKLYHPENLSDKYAAKNQPDSRRSHEQSFDDLVDLLDQYAAKKRLPSVVPLGEMKLALPLFPPEARWMCTVPERFVDKTGWAD